MKQRSTLALTLAFGILGVALGSRISRPVVAVHAQSGPITTGLVRTFINQDNYIPQQFVPDHITGEQHIHVLNQTGGAGSCQLKSVLYPGSNGDLDNWSIILMGTC